MHDDSITERKVETRQEKTGKDPDETEFHGDNVQLNVNQQTYRK